MSEKLVTVERAARNVRYVTLNRPDKRNAISTPLRAELFAVLARTRQRHRRACLDCARCRRLFLVGL